MDTPISASGGIGGAYENHHGLISVPGTFFTYPDLYAAVTTCWIGCDAVQPLLTKAVTLHGGQTIHLSAQPSGKSGAWTPLLELNSLLITGRPPLPELPSDQPSRPESPCELFPQLFNPFSAAVEPIEPPVPASHSTAGNDC